MMIYLSAGRRLDPRDPQDAAKIAEMEERKRFLDALCEKRKRRRDLVFAMANAAARALTRIPVPEGVCR